MDDIERQFKDIEYTAQQKASRALRKAIIATADQIIAGAPVRTGRLRSNWQVTINTQALNELEAGAKVNYTALASIKFGDVCYITNNLPYAEFIEYGDYQGQHRQGVVRQAVLEFDQKHQKYIKQEGGE